MGILSLLMMINLVAFCFLCRDKPGILYAGFWVFLASLTLVAGIGSLGGNPVLGILLTLGGGAGTYLLWSAILEPQHGLGEKLKRMDDE